MPLLAVAVLAALSGIAEALAVSPSGHAAVARLWIEPAGARAEAVIALGTAIGLIVAGWPRLRAALGEGVRAVARPAVFGGSVGAHDARTLLIASGASLAVGLGTVPRAAAWAGSPTAAGLGLCVTGLALGSTWLAPRLGFGEAPRSSPGPSLAGAALVGLAHGLAVFPGASRVGAALTVLLWIGVRPSRAVDLALLLTAPSLLVTFARGAAGGLGAGTVALALIITFVTTVLASEGLGALVVRRRQGALALWTIPLGLALLAYARALPHAP